MTRVVGTHRFTSAHVDYHTRRWWALASVATAQLMMGIDSTIMNVALPSAQRSLHLSDPGRQWVITVFALTYGGLLLLGGRLSDLIGRRRSLLIGLAGFALASAIGGFAVNPAMLLISRALQGVFGALLTPSVLGTLAHTFPTPAERGKAFGIYGTVMGSSTGLGVLLGGVLTGYLDWHWCMFVFLPIAAVAATGVLYAVRPVPPGTGVRVDFVGAVLATAGLMALVYGFARAEVDGWGAVSTAVPLALGVLSLVAFVWVQARIARPLLPLRVVLNRRRAGSYLAVLGLAVGMFGALFFLTFHFQNALRYPPVLAGTAFLPLTVGLIAGARVVSPLLARAPVRALLLPGLLTLAGGLSLLGLVRIDSSYWLHLLPVLLLVGFGSGAVLITANSTATLGAKADTSVAGAMVMTSQQMGVSLGTALLSTVAAIAAADYAQAHPTSAVQATVYGFNVASFGAAGFLALAASVVFFVIGPRVSARHRYAGSADQVRPVLSRQQRAEAPPPASPVRRPDAPPAWRPEVPPVGPGRRPDAPPASPVRRSDAPPPVPPVPPVRRRDEPAPRYRPPVRFNPTVYVSAHSHAGHR